LRKKGEKRRKNRRNEEGKGKEVEGLARGTKGKKAC